MKKMLIAGACALLATTGVAQAAPTVTSTTALPLVDFGTGDGNGLQAAATATAAAAGYVFTGSAGVFSGSFAGTNGSDGYTSPFSTNQNYLAIEPNGSITFSVGAAQTTFGILIGTLDSYNRLTFTGAQGQQTFSGDQILAMLSGNPNSDANGTGRLNLLFSGLDPFTSVTASDTQFSAFEFVPAVTSSVPEPAAWGMMILGFGLVGGVMRRRSSTKAKVHFA